MTLLSRQERPPGPHSWAGNKLNQMYPDFAGGPISRRNEAIGACRIEQERDCLQVVGQTGTTDVMRVEGEVAQPRKNLWGLDA